MMFSESIKEVLGARIEAGRLRRDVDLAPFTTFKIGGPADWFFGAETADELAGAVTATRDASIVRRSNRLA